MLIKPWGCRINVAISPEHYFTEGFLRKCYLMEVLLLHYKFEYKICISLK